MVDIELIQTLTGHQNPIYTLETDSTGGVMYSAGNDKGVVEWDWNTLTFNRVLCSVSSSVYALHSIQDTDLLAIGLRSGEIWIVDTVRQELKAKLKVDSGAVFSIRSLQTKQELIAIGEEGRVYVWNLINFDLCYAFRISDTTVRTIAVDPYERYLAFGDKQGYINLCRTSDYQQIVSRQVHEQGITSLHFIGEALFSGGRDARMYKLTCPDLDILEGITPHMFTVYGITDLGTSSLLSTVSRDKTIKVWNEDFKLQKNISRDKGIDSHYLSINAQVFNPELGLLATAGDDKMIKVWKVGDRI